MTIAVGFKCDEGLVLCADTRETIPGYTKTNTQKMTSCERGLYNTVFTGAGDAGLIDMTVEFIDRALTLSRVSAAWQIEETIRKALMEAFQQGIAPYAVFSEAERPSAELLIGVQYPAAACLYYAHGTILRQVHEPQCIGTGLSLGKSLLSQFCDGSLSLARAGLIGLYVVHQAKKWVDGCGGKTDILLLSNRNLAITRLPTDEIEELEKHFDEFNEQVRPLLIATADRQTSDADYKQLMRQFNIEMIGLRGKFMEFDEYYRRLCEVAGVPWSPISQEPSEADSSRSGNS